MSNKIKDALNYPFKKLSRIWSFYWILIPIIGFLAVTGYIVKIIQNLIAGNDKELPKWGKFGENLGKGFFLFLYALVIGVVAMVVNFIPILGQIAYLYLLLIMPMLVINYCKKEKFGDGFAFEKVTKLVFKNFWDYILTVLKTIVVIAALLVASILIVTLIVTVPAMQFTSYYLLTDFYRRHAK